MKKKISFTTLTKNKLKAKKKALGSESTISKKDFRDNPTVEKLYKTIYEYKLREEAYKTAIEIYLNRLLKAEDKK